MKTLGYVNQFNIGIPRVQKELVNNGNGLPQFGIDKQTVFEVFVNRSQKYGIAPPALDSAVLPSSTTSRQAFDQIFTQQIRPKFKLNAMADKIQESC